jgi:hypothetical protein
MHHHLHIEVDIHIGFALDAVWFVVVVVAVAVDIVDTPVVDTQTQFDWHKVVVEITVVVEVRDNPGVELVLEALVDNPVDTEVLVCIEDLEGIKFAEVAEAVALHKSTHFVDIRPEQVVGSHIVGFGTLVVVLLVVVVGVRDKNKPVGYRQGLLLVVGLRRL